MPIHDWTRVTAGIFHAFHSGWIAEIQKSLNGGMLPRGYYALAEQVAGNTVADVLTLQGNDDSEPDGADDGASADGGGVAVATAPPRMSVHDKLSEARVLANRQRRIVIRHTTGDRVVALLEIISPGNKGPEDMLDQFLEKAEGALNARFQLMLIDLFPPGKFDHDGMHGSFWGRMGGGEYSQPGDKPLTLAAYSTYGQGLVECFVEPTAVGSPLIDMPLFLSPERYVNVPLEQTYLSAYDGVPKRWRAVIEGKVGR